MQEWMKGIFTAYQWKTNSGQLSIYKESTEDTDHWFKTRGTAIRQMYEHLRYDLHSSVFIISQKKLCNRKAEHINSKNAIFEKLVSMESGE